MKNKKGFISMSLIYSFFIVFIALVLALIANYTHNRILVRNIGKDIKSKLDSNAVTASNTFCADKGITTLYDCVLATNGGASSIINKNNFESTATSNEGMYAAEDEYGISYYFRGNVLNNNVIFAGFQWKIIRINGNGTVRLIYNGTETDYVSNGNKVNTIGTNTQIGTSAFQSSTNDNTYLGYMIGGNAKVLYADTHTNASNSTVKNILDSWYVANIIAKGSTVTSKIADNIFCNDRNTRSGDTGAGTNTTYYAAYVRLIDEKNPTLQCKNMRLTNQSNDQFTLSTNSVGNKKQTYPVGLITADEVAMAGGVGLVANTSYYLRTNSAYLTMSPYYFSGSANIFMVSANGSLTNSSVSTSRGVRPVINLIPTAPIASGSGTTEKPYIIS